MMHSSFTVSGISRDEAYRLIRATDSELTDQVRDETVLVRKRKEAA